MIFYIASQALKPIVSNSIQETDMILVGSECSNEFFLLKYVKENISNSSFSGLDIFIIDTCALKDTDEDIIQAFEMLRIMSSDLRIVVLATNRCEGDELLRQCFNMSIYDIITTDDFLKIKEELCISITEGRRYRDALPFKDTITEDPTKYEMKQNVDQIMIAVAGSEQRIGVTHNVIVLANYLRKRGYLVAVAEMNQSNDFEKIRKSFVEPIIDESYFTLKGIDYYRYGEFQKVLEKPYNFIIVDFGLYEKCSIEAYQSSEVQIIIAGAKPWEIDNVASIFKMTEEEILKEYHYCFNFVLASHQDDIRDGMEVLKNVYFTNYTDDPFFYAEFAGAEIILKEYLPVEVVKEKEKSSIFKKKRKGDK